MPWLKGMTENGRVGGEVEVRNDKPRPKVDVDAAVNLVVMYVPSSVVINFITLTIASHAPLLP